MSWLILPMTLAGSYQLGALQRLFAYGTLLSGESNHRFLVNARYLAPGRTRPAFRLHNLGGFPGLVLGGTQSVLGEVYEVDEQILAAIDKLEDHPRFYRRTPITLEGGSDVQTYLLTPQQVAGRPLIESGDWRAHRRAVLLERTPDRGAPIFRRLVSRMLLSRQGRLSEFTCAPQVLKSEHSETRRMP